MLRFLKLTIEDFGPFKGRQTIDFTGRDGVTIVWGDNGRGKTTLLNIFRYALFGKIQNRRGVINDLTSISNKEGRWEGRFGFKVILHMDVDGTSYELTRQYKVREGVPVPTSNDDFEQLVFLKENTSILPSAERDHGLKKIMPEQVARFFLFDGELLQEYEELLSDDTVTGTAIKESIEKILGVPVLTSSEADAEAVLNEYKKAKNRIAQSNKQTQQIAARMLALEAQLSAHQEEYNRLRDALRTELANKDGLETELSQTERIRALIAEAKSLEISIDEKQTKQEELLSSIRATTKEAWKTLIQSRVDEVLADTNTQIQTLEERTRAQITAEHFLEDMRKALAEHHCHICDQDINAVLLRKMQERIKYVESNYGGISAEEQAILDGLRVRRLALQGMQFPTCKDKLEIYEKEYEATTVQIGHAKQQLKSVREDIEKYGDIDGVSERVQQLVLQHSQSIAKITNLEEGKRKESEIIEETKSALTTLDGQINRLAQGAQLDAAMRRVELCEQLHSIFEQGVAAYRDKLKKDVERDATEIFTSISNDPDYVNLEINENYGLSIVHSSGVKVPLRSAGYEHIVALALIGALHKNAPLRGPVIMDSPFGRLDPGHKEKITRMLPRMSEQIVLLAYTHEIDEQAARSTLGGALNNEYRLSRITSFHTEINTQRD
ncbi:hypothetical protein CE91St46_33200 [Eubacteriales bacterium]|nr:AAA family ATPase [Faecalicatena sp. BF-R-105]GKH52209.1 hypothetical protein CE91St46_33200 [Eubacteriales bacterium]GKH64929.1 hypothetical protein CE91St47_33980 [Eubacteriales bacterium]